MENNMQSVNINEQVESIINTVLSNDDKSKVDIRTIVYLKNLAVNLRMYEPAAKLRELEKSIIKDLRKTETYVKSRSTQIALGYAGLNISLTGALIVSKIIDSALELENQGLNFYNDFDIKHAVMLEQDVRKIGNIDFLDIANQPKETKSDNKKSKETSEK